MLQKQVLKQGFSASDFIKEMLLGEILKGVEKARNGNEGSEKRVQFHTISQLQSDPTGELWSEIYASQFVLI